jgi:hypothetical protein
LTSLNADEMGAIKAIVHHTLQINDANKALNFEKTKLENAKRVMAEAKAKHDKEIASIEISLNYHRKCLVGEECKLRKLILQDVIVTEDVHPEPAPEPEKLVEEHEDLGRDE